MNLMLIDVDDAGSGIVCAWEKSRILERLKSIEGKIAYWDSHQKFEDTLCPVFSNVNDVVRYAHKESLSTIIHIYADQCFLDTKIVKNGLEKMHADGADYFTQWEHCRLPKGIGIRAYSLAAIPSHEVESFSEIIEHVTMHPVEFRMLCEDHNYVTFEQSMLDARLSEQEIDQNLSEIETFDLEGFLKLKIEATRENVHADKGSPITDERGIPAAYGFESSECATFPSYVMFDITNRCNAKCIHCPQSTIYADNKHKSGFLDLNIFKKVIDECQGRAIQFVRITADGEPFVHPKMFDMIDYAVGVNVGPVGLTTNGSLMHPAKAERLVQSGLFVVDVSLDALRKETFEKIRVGLSYEDTFSNTEHLIEYRNSVKSPLKIMVSFVIQDDNKEELDEFVKYWEPKVDKVLIRELHTNVNTVDVESAKEVPKVERWPCPHWFRRVVINFDGNFKACPIDWENESVFRSVSEVSVYETWHSDFYWKNRMEHLNNRFCDESLCKNCPDWQGTPWDVGYEKVVSGLNMKSS